MQTTQLPGTAIEGYDTDLYDTVENIDVTNASGSCRAMPHVRIETVQYVAKNVSVPSGSSMTLDQLFSEYPQFAAGPNCAATVTIHRGGVSVPAGGLVLYSRLTMDMPEEEARMKQAAALFAVPSGFRQQP